MSMIGYRLYVHKYRFFLKKSEVESLTVHFTFGGRKGNKNLVTHVTYMSINTLMNVINEHTYLCVLV